MKKLLFALQAVVLTFAVLACSSEHVDIDETPIVEKGYHVVTYDLEGLPTNLRATSLESSGVKSLLYLLYNSNGVLVKQKIWSKGQDLSMINDTLPQGNYNVIFYGSSSDDADANVDPVSKYFLEHLETDTTFFFLKNSINTDMFYNKSGLEVGKSDVTQQIVMSRIVGKVNILISDAATVPTDVKNIQVAIAPYHPTVFGLQNEQTIYTEGDTEDTYFMPVTDLMTRAQFLTATAANTPLSFLMLANTELYNQKGQYPSLYFIIERTNGKVQYVYIKEELVVYRNQILQLYGNLFDKFESSIDLGGINIEDQWGATITEPIP